MMLLRFPGTIAAKEADGKESGPEGVSEHFAEIIPRQSAGLREKISSAGAVWKSPVQSVTNRTVEQSGRVKSSH